jgi:hypothetical protein
MTDQPDEFHSPTLAPRRCLVVSSRGACLMPPLADSDFCWNHDPSRSDDRAAARRRGGQRGKRSTAGQVPDGLELRDVPAIQALLERAVVDCLALDNGVQRARTLGYLAGLALQALSVGSFEDRLTALEQSAGMRRSA